MEQVPRMVEWGSQSLLPWLSATFGVDLVRDQEEMIGWLQFDK